MKTLVLLQVLVLLLALGFEARPVDVVAGARDRSIKVAAESSSPNSFGESIVAEAVFGSWSSIEVGAKQLAAPSRPEETTNQPELTTRTRSWPIDSEVTRGYEPPVANWLPGHRGIDLAAEPGVRIRVAETGTVSWVGVIDGVSMMTVTHQGAIRTTYQPVETLLSVGTRVKSGDVIGIVANSPENYEHDGLHFGVRRGEQYLDPVRWLAGRSLSPIRLFGVQEFPD